MNEPDLTEVKAARETRARKRIDWMVSTMAMSERFFFEILARMVRKPSYSVPTMAVGPCGIQVLLYYNPDFVETLEDTELRWVLVHEVAHVVLHHISHRRPTDLTERTLHNWAADLAVNSLFRSTLDYRYPKVPEGRDDETWVLLPWQFGYPEFLSMEQYRDLLRQDLQQGKIYLQAETDDVFDQHLDWQDNPGLSAQVREWVGRIQAGQGWGCLGGEEIAAVLAAQHSTVPWTRLLRYHFGHYTVQELHSTFKRPARRVGYPWCGKTRHSVGKTLVAIDTSGSIREADLASFLAETNGLAASHPVDLVTWDTRVHMEKPQPWPRRKPSFKFHGRGGTNVQPVVDMAHRLRYRQVVILTDGEFAPPDIPAGLGVLWVLLPGGSPEACVGGTVICITGGIL